MTLAAPQQSTTVRTSSRSRVLRGVALALRTLESGSPRAAAMVAEQLMFRTQRFPPPRGSAEVMARGERLAIPSRRGGDLAAWRWGDGRPVLLVHGWNGRADQLAPFVDPLLDRGFSVIAFDAPGHGASPGSMSSLFDFADAIDDVIDAVRPPFDQLEAIVAHSMGGAAATYAMSRQSRAPRVSHERVQHETGLPARRFAFLAAPIDVGDFVRGFARMFGLGPSFVAALRERVESRFGIALEDVYAPRLARDLAAPLLVVHDEDDREVPVDRGRILAAAWPGAELEVTRGLGHLRILRDAGVVARVTAFVDGSSRGAVAA